MTRDAEHISDDVLLRIIEDDDFDIQQSGIETHISNCAECQTRLETISSAAWMDSHRDDLARDFSSMTLSMKQLDAMNAVSTTQLASDSSGNRQPSRDFEMLAIEQMLEKILLPPTHPETLGRLGDYEVEAVIGYGGMGVVLRAFDRELQRVVAIKLIVPNLAHDGTAKQRFAREARAAAAILHPNVIAIHGINETNGVPWFVMPLINGPSLRELVEINGPLHEQDIVRIGLQIASGLAAAHSRGVIHRDIKPENILVDNKINRVAITDFGLARQEFDATLTRSGILAGTLNYMSPEQTKGDDVDSRSDLFSLGSVLYFLATGSTPFRADSPGRVLHKVVNEKQSDVRTLNPEISASLSATIDRLLEKKPEARFQTAAELECFLARLVSHMNQPTQHDLPKLPKRSHRRNWLRNPLLLATAAIVVFAATLLALVLNMVPESQRPKTKNMLAQEYWAEIQANYQFEPSDEFAKRFGALEQEVGSLSRQFAQDDWSQTDDLNRRLNSLTRDISELSKALDFADFR